MTNDDLNVLTRELGSICRDRVLEEKWLIAPSRRVGYEWLDRVARSGRPVLNVSVKTFRNIALELAAREMDGLGVQFLRGVRAEVLTDRVLNRMRSAERGYLSALDRSPGLTRTVYQAIRDLRLAGLSSGDLKAGAFEVKDKGAEIKKLLAEYEKELDLRRLVDYPTVLRMAVERLEEDTSAIGEDTLILLPEDVEAELRGLEKSLWEALPEGNRAVLAVDRPGGTPEAGMTDAALLGWIERPAEAPAPSGDGTASMFRAVGEVNEVREVFRRCVEAGIPFDSVEIIHTDRQTYVPLAYELSARLMPEEGETVPVTFSEGIPASYSRPGRALSAWVSWIREGYPQATMVRMVQEGLMRIPGAAENGLGFSRLGAILRAVAIGAGRDAYPARLDVEMASLEKRLERFEAGEDGEEDGDPAADRKGLMRHIEGLRTVRDLISDIVEHTPPVGTDEREVLEQARYFLEERARIVSQVDAYSRDGLLDEIVALIGCLEEGETVSGLGVWEWLARLPGEVRVCGQGPRPGCLYVTNVMQGGHSGREHTFIVGMDNGRFPGAGLQDPVLLDAERARISDDLSTAGGRTSSKVGEFNRLLARLRGEVTLSFPCRSLADDREMFPSGALLSAYRVLSGEHDGDQGMMLKWLDEPVSFAPQEAGRSIDMTEWWLWRICAAKKVSRPEKVIGENFPHLERGFKARDARESAELTEYDGYVPQAGKDNDPTVPGGIVVSASRLGTMGSCPMQYFFEYVLGIEQPEEYVTDTSRWLDPLQQGTLLHEVFYEFMVDTSKEGLLPKYERDRDRLFVLLDAHIKKWKARVAPPSEEVFAREVRRLETTTSIFLFEEEEFCARSVPRYFEVAIGMEREGGGTTLDCDEAVSLELPGGMTIRARCRIDRVDEVPGSGGKKFTVWDYKTGRGRKFKGNDPFNQGRLVQVVLYPALAERRLREAVHESSRVVEFGYFFPGIAEHGLRLGWRPEQLEKGMHVVALLCRLLANGCFVFTDNTEDVDYSDYRPAFVDVDTSSEQIRRKLKSTGNEALDPFRELRGYQREDGGWRAQ